MIESGRRARAIIGAAGILAAALYCAGGLRAESELEGYSPKVTDWEARIQLARILSYDEDSLGESLAEYRKLLKSRPNDRRISLESAHVLVRLGRRDEAMAIIDGILLKSPRDRDALVAKARIHAWAGEMEEAADTAAGIEEKALNDPGSLLALADTYAFMGSSSRAWEAFSRALKAAPRKTETRYIFAASMMALGDYYEAQTACRNWLKANEGDRAGRLRLAESLAGMGRFGEASGIYREILLERPKYGPAHLGLARLAESEGEQGEAEAAATRALELDSGNREALAIRARARFAQGSYEGAAGDYVRLSKLEPAAVRGPLGAARAYCALKDRKAAQLQFDMAERIRPASPAVVFWGQAPDLGGEGNACVRVSRPPSIESAYGLAELGGLHQSMGDARRAAELYRRALAREPGLYSARIRLAEVLAADRKFADALEILDGLARERPRNYLVLSLKAQVLGQAGRYDEAFAEFDRMHEADSRDPGPLLGKARVASWGRRTAAAMEGYEKLLDPAVDKLLAKDLVAPARDSAVLAKLRRQLTARIKQGSVYEGYAELAQALEQKIPDLSRQDEQKLRTILTRRYAVFYVNRIAGLEKGAKSSYLEDRYREAMTGYERLLAVSPGSAEAAFEYSQAACALGRCRQERRGYELLLRAAPAHQAGRTIRQAVVARSHPAVSGRHRYQEESGRGRLSGMSRHDLGGTAEFPVFCRLRMRAGAGWREERFEEGKGRPRSRCGSLGFWGSLSSRISLGGEWSYVEYEDSAVSSRQLGFGRMDVLLGRRLEAGASYERTEESHNRVAFAREIMADNWSARALFRLSDRWDVSANYRLTDLSDQNVMQLGGVRVGRAFGDSRRRLVLSGLGEYRDTESPSGPYSEFRLIDHPYWTPADHLDGSFSVEWRHNLSRFPFCGGPAKSYRVEARVGSNSEDDIYGRGELSADWEMTKDWFLALSGMIYNSREFRAASTWSSLGYRF